MSKLEDPSAEEKSSIHPQPGSLSEPKDPSPLKVQLRRSVERTLDSLAWRLIRLPLWLLVHLYGSPNVFPRFLGHFLTITILDAIVFQLWDWGYTCYVLRRQYQNWALAPAMYWVYACPYGFWARFRPLPLSLLVQNSLDRLHNMLFVAGFYALGGLEALMRLISRVSFLGSRGLLRNVVGYLIICAIADAVQRGYVSVAIRIGFSPSYYSLCGQFWACTLGAGEDTRSGYRRYWIRVRQG
jgi:hypothetical protein